MIEQLIISNFKSIKEQTLDLKRINIFIGQNGAGKSNLISLFTFLEKLYWQGLNDYFFMSGGIEHFLYGGIETSNTLGVKVLFEENSGYKNYYQAKLQTEGERYRFIKDEFGYVLPKHKSVDYSRYQGSESSLKDANDYAAEYVRYYLRSFRVYHFHDTTNNAQIKQPQPIDDVYEFKNEGQNIAPYLLWMKNKHPNNYRRVVESIQLVYPLFLDFDIAESPFAKGKVILRWRERGTSNSFHVRQVSDGTLRFMCLAVLLNKPYNFDDSPETIIIDEPELGLHPFALEILAELIQKASQKCQLIIATQSITLIDHFTPEDIVVTERDHEGATVFSRKSSDELKDWLEDYSLGQIWLSNLMGGRP